MNFKILAFDSENNNYKKFETLKSSGDFMHIQFNLLKCTRNGIIKKTSIVVAIAFDYGKTNWQRKNKSNWTIWGNLNVLVENLQLQMAFLTILKTKPVRKKKLGLANGHDI